MGRPVNKRYFGDPETTEGSQFYIIGNVGSGLEQCYIIKQTATRTFLCRGVTSDNELRVRLVNGPDEATEVGLGYMDAGLVGSDSVVRVAAVDDGGTGYTTDDVATVSGGTGTSATLTVTAAAGVVTDATVTNEGDYSVRPTNPVATTGAGNSDATFNLAFGSIDDQYVYKLSNKNLAVNGLVRQTYTINDEDTSATRNVEGG